MALLVIAAPNAGEWAWTIAERIDTIPTDGDPLKVILGGGGIVHHRAVDRARWHYSVARRLRTCKPVSHALSQERAYKNM